jgi:DNA polymerase-1
VLYGAGWKRVFFEMTKAGFTDVTEAQCKGFVKRLREYYSGVWEFKLQLDAELERGAVLYNLLGRPFKIQSQSDVYMKGLNTLIQGSASDLLQEGAYKLRLIGLTPLLLVHDEVIVEVPEADANEAEAVIEEALTMRRLPTKHGNIPIRVEGKVSKSWEK